MKEFKVSVIVPVYNAEKYIEKCVASLVNQTLKDIEIIIINDGSTDNTLNILNKLSKSSNIKVITTKNNGIGITRNNGLKKAKGDYIFFLDGDDYIENNALELMYNTAISKKADIVICDMYKVFNDNRLETSLKIDFCNGALKENKAQLIQIPLGPCGKLFKKEILKNRFAENLKYEDVPFVSSAIKESKNTMKLNKPLYYYVIHSNSETTTMDERVFDIIKILDMTNKLFDNQKYINDELEYLNIQLLSRYNLQQKYQKDKGVAQKFLDESFLFLNNNFPNWKKNKYLKKRNIFKRIIETNKKLIKLYWKI